MEMFEKEELWKTWLLLYYFFCKGYPRIQCILNIYKYQKTLGPKAITTNNRRLTCQTLVPIMSKMSNKGANEASALQPKLSIIVNDCQQMSTIVNLVNMVKMLKRTFSISTNIRRYWLAKPLSSLCPRCPIKVQMGPQPSNQHCQ